MHCFSNFPHGDLRVHIKTSPGCLLSSCLEYTSSICTEPEGMESWNPSADAHKELIGIKTDYEQEIDHGDTYYFS